MTRKPKSRDATRANIDTAWFADQMIRRGLTARALGQRLGLSETQMSRALGRSAQGRDFRPAELPPLAAALGVSLADLLPRLGATMQQTRWPIVGAIETGATVHWLSGQAAYSIPALSAEYDTLHGLKVVCSTLFGYPAGTLLLYDPQSVARETLVGRVCVVWTADSTQSVLAVVDSGANGHTLHLIGTQERLRGTRISKACAIQLVIYRGYDDTHAPQPD